MNPRESGRMTRSGLSIGEVFRESFDLYKSNPGIIIPSLLPGLWVFIAPFVGLAGPMALFSVGAFGAGMASLMVGMAVFFLIYFILFILAEGMTVEMIEEVYEGHSASIESALEAVLEKIGPLVIASILAAILLSIGYIVFILPGLILTFLLWFVPQAIMLEDESAVGSLKRSFEFVRDNTGDALIIVLVSIGLHVVLSVIPFIGWILLLVAMPYFIGLTTLLYIERI